MRPSAASPTSICSAASRIKCLSEADVFYKIEDMFYNRLLTSCCVGRKVDAPRSNTVAIRQRL